MGSMAIDCLYYCKKKYQKSVLQNVPKYDILTDITNS